MNKFIDEEDIQSKKIIDTIERDIICGMTEFNKVNNCKIGVIYISSKGINEHNIYFIFLPFVTNFRTYQNYANIHFLYIRNFVINVPENFYRWIYDSNTNIIGKITDKTNCAWKCFNNNDFDITILENSLSNDNNNFEDWYNNKQNFNNIKLLIRNPMIYKVPYPVKDFEFSVKNNIYKINI